MLNRSLRRTLGAAAVAAALVLGSTAAAHATPAPDNGPVTGGTTVMVPEPAGVTFTSISGGFSHSVALGSDGNAYAWGQNNFGQLGDGTNTNRSTPVQVQAPAGITFTSISGGYYHSVALGSDGNAYAWGQNNFGQLGDGTNTTSNTPVQVQAPAGITFTSISGGYHHSVALGSDGNAYAWGQNNDGQLGDGTNTTSNTPVQVQAPAGITFTSISGGYYHSVALGSDGNAYAWGQNNFGQLGDGTNTTSNTPVQVQAPAGITFTSISGGYYHSVALGSDGNAYAWGQNNFGQLGDGTNTNRNTPVQVQAPAGVTFTSISSGWYHSVALGSDGNAYAWGQNIRGQLGDGTNTNRNTPVQVQAPAGVTFTSISSGMYHSVALGSDGNAYAWGYNYMRQLGDGTNTNSNTPVQVLGDVVVTRITFDGVEGTNLVDNGDGTWSVDTPAHAEGAVDVVVSYTWNNIAQTPVTYTGGYTYTPIPVAPTITNPADQSVTDGDTATFTVTTTGTPTPTVTWEVSRDGGTTWETITADPAATPAADGLTLSVVGTSANDGYQYRATATSSAGDATSQIAKLTVTPIPVAPTITNPADQSVTDGDTATFTVTTTGTPTPTVTWEVSRDGGTTWETITADPAATPAADGLTLSVVGTSANDGYQYRATATSSAGDATSQIAKLTVTPIPVAPTITNPADQSVTDGDTATFTVTTTGTPTPTVTWEVSRDGGTTWETITADPAATPAADGLTLSVVGTSANDGYQYRATATSSAGDATSQIAKLTVTPIPVAPTITNPADQSVTDGDTATFTVTTTGTPTPTVTWEVSRDGGTTWETITADPAATPAADGLTLSVVGTSANDGYQYRATATSSAGDATSQIAKLTVTPIPVAPTITNPADQSVTDGDTATFTVTTTGTPTPTVTWEVSRDGGTTWETITADPAATPAADGLTLSVVGTSANDGYQYRATATSSAGDATSQIAKLTVTPIPVAPTITNPADQSVTDGDTATFTVTTTGTPTPTVTWEVSRDGGTTWETITADPAATPAADGLTLSVVGTSANDGYQYRATATSSAGDATSQIAKLTVTPKAGTDTPKNEKDQNVSTELAFTGSEATPAFLIAALVALLLGAGLVTANRVAKRRVNR